MLSDITRQLTGPLQCSHNIICLWWEAFQRNKGSVTQQLPQEESCLSWGATVCLPPQDCISQPLSSFRLLCAIQQDFSRKLGDGFVAISKLTSCVACLKRLIVSLLHLPRLFQKVAPSITKCLTVEKTGCKWNLGKAFLFKI